MNSVIRFGIIGTGRMAAAMMPAFSCIPSVRVVAVASQSKERADNFRHAFKLAKAYVGSETMLADSQIDAVYIANETENHARCAISALQAGKAVLCEKPIGISFSEAEQVALAAKQAEKLCMEAMWTPFLPAYQRLFELADSESLGSTESLYADFGYPSNESANPRLFMPTPGAGVLLDRSPYAIVLSLKLFGEVSQLSACVRRSEQGVDTAAGLQLKHSNDRVSQLMVSITGLLQNRAVLTFAKGAVSLEPPFIGAETLRITRAPTIAIAASSDASRMQLGLKQSLRRSSVMRRLNSLRRSGAREHHSYGQNQYVPMVNHFCALYHGGRLESEMMPLRLSAEVLRIVEQARKL